MTEQIYHLGIKALIKRPDGLVLAIKKIGPEIFWDLPGGRVQVGETPIQTLHREVAEEIGTVMLNNITPLNVVVTPIFVNQTDVRLIVWYFSCTVDGPVDVHLDTEFGTYKWVPYAHIRDEFKSRGIDMPDHI